MSNTTNRNYSGIVTLFLLLIATSAVIYFVSSRGNNLSLKNVFNNKENDETELISEPENSSTEESDTKLVIYKLLEDDIRSQISNKSKASLDVTTFYIKKNPQMLYEGYSSYPFEIQTATGRVREEVNNNENFVLIISENNFDSESIEIDKKIDIEGLLEVESDEHPFGRIYRITSDDENPINYYLLFNSKQSDKIFEDLTYKKVRVKTNISDITTDKVTYTYLSGPSEIR